MASALTLACGDARVDIAPEVGGALAAFTHRGRDVLRPASAEASAASNVRGHACYPLVPFSNRIAGAALSFGGSTHALARNFADHPHAIHGVGWQRPWSVIEHDLQSVRLTLEHRPARQAVRDWPWPFDAWQSIALAAARDRALLTLVLGIQNCGVEPFPFGLGWHPYFPRDTATVLGFRARAVWQTDATLLPTALVDSTGAWRFDPARPIGATVLDNVHTGWDGEALLADPAGRSTTAIRADRACRFLVVFAPASRGFVAIEPVTHMTDAFNRAHRGETATGTRVLAPGAAFSCTMQIEARADR